MPCIEIIIFCFEIHKNHQENTEHFCMLNLMLGLKFNLTPEQIIRGRRRNNMFDE